MKKDFFIAQNIPVYCKKVSVSTMVDAASKIDSGEAIPFVCLADHQTGGRGRRPGRTWVDSEGSLLFTAVFAQADVLVDIHLFPLVVAGSLVKVLLDYGILALNIAWPNDLLLNEKKISGVLCERRGEYIMVGVGVNLTDVEFTIDLRKPASSVFRETGLILDKIELLERFIMEMSSLNLEETLEVINDFLYKKNQLVKILVGDPSSGNYVDGLVIGVAEDGTLVVDVCGERQFIAAGEIVFS
ncbi:MAG: biotin--[acetyl-CoA-carboxylase] ligase [Spirochaetales bacterium]|nr:biotin--[acetyl-CoA-carboxylase] ligase [Spirochaetales bacterium]